MATEPAEEDLELAWDTSSRALDQSDIDNLFGDEGQGNTQKRKGFEVLVSGALVGVDRLPMLNILVDRLAQLMTVSMRAFTADNADVSIDRTRPVRLQEFLNGVPLPAMIAVIRIEEWDGYCLAALDPRLIGSAVDILLGGRRNNAMMIEGRPYTAIERSFVERLVNEVIIRDLRRAFELICDVDFTLERFETTPSYAAITKMSAGGVGFRAEISLEQRGGHIDFMFPFSTLEPIRDRLSQEFVGKKHGNDAAWRNHLLNELPRANVRLRAVVESRPAWSSEVLSWRVGSKLQLNRRHDEPIDVFCDDLLLLRARIAERGGRIALRVEERRLTEGGWPPVEHAEDIP